MYAVFGTRAVACDQDTQAPSGGHSHDSRTPGRAPMNARAGWAKERQFAPATASPAQARDFVERPLIQHGLVHLAGDIRLVVSELVTNAVVHARTSIRVRIEELPCCVKVTVCDGSVDLPVLSLSAHLSDETEHGRGLWIVDACSSDWGTDLMDGEGKAIWARWPCGPGPDASRATLCR